MIRPGTSLRPAIAVARLANVCGFAVGGALRSFFVVAEANRTKRRSTSNSRSSGLNPSSYKPNIRTATEAGFPPIMPPTGAERPARNRERGFGQRLKISADVKCRDSPKYLT